MSDNNFEEALSSILGNDDLMSKISEIVNQNKGGDISNAIPQIMNVLSSNATPKKESENQDATEAMLKNETESTHDDDGAFPKKAIEAFGKSISKNAKLLHALKPYLSKERAEMIDNIIRISQIADIMKFVK